LGRIVFEGMRAVTIAHRNVRMSFGINRCIQIQERKIFA